MLLWLQLRLGLTAVFHANGKTDVAEIEDAHSLLSPLLGVGIASVLFAIALLASGLNSTVTATLAGQIVVEASCVFACRTDATPANPCDCDRSSRDRHGALRGSGYRKAPYS